MKSWDLFELTSMYLDFTVLDCIEVCDCVLFSYLCWSNCPC